MKRNKTTFIIKIFQTLKAILLIAIPLILGLFLATGLILGTWFYNEIYLLVPENVVIPIEKFQNANYYYSANNEQLYSEFYDVNRTMITYDKLPQHLIYAVLAIEDEDFFNHQGYSVKALARAFKNNYIDKTGTIQGASTITQQLVKNVFLDNERSFKRKLLEILYSIRLEKNYSKEEILAYWFNTVNFGGTTYGIQASAKTYFDSDTQDLSLAESSFLAGLPASPGDLNPLENFNLAKNRQKLVLNAMVKNGVISVEQAESAFNDELIINVPTNFIKYPHFVYYTRNYIENLLGENEFKKGGLKIYTTLETTIQDFAQSSVSNKKEDLKKYNISNAGVLISKVKTGEIVAMVGSMDYNDYENGGSVNLTNSLRQVGSSIKPFNYALFLEKGNTNVSLILDSPVTYRTPNSKESYSPKNYDGKYRGMVTVRRALSNSLNIPAVKVLEKNGVEQFVDFLGTFGVEKWPEERYGLALTLGSGEVRMTQMNQAFSVFPNEGWKAPINPIKFIENNKGDIIYFNPCKFSISDFEQKNVIAKPESCKESVITKETAFLITSILTDNISRAETFGINSSLNIKGVGAKTGTTNDFRDNWTFGFNSEYVVGTWVGNNDNRPMNKLASGITGAAPIWAENMKNVTNLSNEINLAERMPEKIITVKICRGSNTLPCASCSVSEEYFVKGTQPKFACKAEEKKENADEKDKDGDDD